MRESDELVPTPGVGGYVPPRPREATPNRQD